MVTIVPARANGAQGAATGCEEITALADRGYFNGEQVLACEGTGVLPCIPKTLWPSIAKRGFFTRQDFIFDAEKDHYTCPAGAKLTRGPARSDRKDDIDHYHRLFAQTEVHAGQAQKGQALAALRRPHKMQARLDHMPNAMGVRRQTVEHPFGTLKSWMGSAHFLTRTFEKVRMEMSLHVLA